jgi:transposase
MTRAEQAAREQVRMQAAALFERGESISKVAAALRVGVRQVEKWHSSWVKGGNEALRSKGPQSTPRLSEEQFARLEQELLRGPARHGWDVDQRWTLALIVTMVWRLFRISYTPAGMSVLLHRNGWTAQVPHRRASDWVTSVAFGTTPDGRLLLDSASDDNTVRVWDPATGVTARDHSGDPVPAPLRGLAA